MKKVLAGTLYFRGAVLEHVIVRSIQELSDECEAKYRPISLQSQYIIYRVITEEANSLLHASQMDNDTLLQTFFRWIKSFTTLYKKHCVFCGRISSKSGNFLPPLRRIFANKLLKCYHIQCSETVSYTHLTLPTIYSV